MKVHLVTAIFFLAATALLFIPFSNFVSADNSSNVVLVVKVDGEITEAT